jgi:hypothetical protein
MLMFDFDKENNQRDLRLCFAISGTHGGIVV